MALQLTPQESSVGGWSNWPYPGGGNGEQNALVKFCTTSSLFSNTMDDDTCRQCYMDAKTTANWCNGTPASDSAMKAFYSKWWRHYNMPRKKASSWDKGGGDYTKKIIDFACQPNYDGLEHKDIETMAGWRNEYCSMKKLGDCNAEAMLAASDQYCNQKQNCNAATGEGNSAWKGLYQDYVEYRKQQGKPQAEWEAYEDVDHFSQALCGRRYWPCWKVVHPDISQNAIDFAKAHGLDMDKFARLFGPDIDKPAQFCSTLTSDPCSIDDPSVDWWIDNFYGGSKKRKDRKVRLQAWKVLNDFRGEFCQKTSAEANGCFKAGGRQIDQNAIQALLLMGLDLSDPENGGLDQDKLDQADSMVQRMCAGDGMSFDQFKKEMRGIIGTNPAKNQDFLWGSNTFANRGEEDLFQFGDLLRTVDADGKTTGFNGDPLGKTYAFDDWLRDAYNAVKRTLCGGQPFLVSNKPDPRCWPPQRFYDLDWWYYVEKRSGDKDKFRDRKNKDNLGSWFENKNTWKNKSKLDNTNVPTFAEIVTEWRDYTLGPESTGTVCKYASMDASCKEDQPVKKWEKLWCDANGITDADCKKESIKRHGCDAIMMMNETCQALGMNQYDHNCLKEMQNKGLLKICDSDISGWDERYLYGFPDGCKGDDGGDGGSNITAIAIFTGVLGLVGFGVWSYMG